MVAGDDDSLQICEVINDFDCGTPVIGGYCFCESSQNMVCLERIFSSSASARSDTSLVMLLW